MRRRVLLVLMAAALMAVMLVITAGPAMARGSEGIVSFDVFNDTIRIAPPNPIAPEQFITHETPPSAVFQEAVEHNPNAVTEISGGGATRRGFEPSLGKGIRKGR